MGHGPSCQRKQLLNLLIRTLTLTCLILAKILIAQTTQTHQMQGKNPTPKMIPITRLHLDLDKS